MALDPLHEAHIRGVAVTFSVSAPDLDPDAVSAATGLQPDASARRGDVRRNRAGTPLRSEVEGWWALGTRGKLESKDVREHFRYLCERLLPHVEAIRAFARGGETFFDVFWQSTYLYAGTGPLLDAADLAGVAALGAGMGFDIYQLDEDADNGSRDQRRAFTPRRSMTGIRLRPVAASDLDTFFEHQRDPVALRVGTLTSRERSEFDTHWARILADPLGILRTVESEGAVVGYVGSFVREGLREVAYWYGREHWGKGIATAALRELLAEVHERPLFARVTVDHTASHRVLEKVGFFIEARESTAGSSGDEIEEFLLRLD